MNSLQRAIYNHEVRKWIRWNVWRGPIHRVRRWIAQARCEEHEPISVRVGLMSAFAAGSEGRQRVICARCGITILDY